MTSFRVQEVKVRVFETVEVSIQFLCDPFDTAGQRCVVYIRVILVKSLIVTPITQFLIYFYYYIRLTFIIKLLLSKDSPCHFTVTVRRIRRLFVFFSETAVQRNASLSFLQFYLAVLPTSVGTKAFLL